MDLATKIKSPIWASRFEINWSAGKIRSPRVSGRVLTYTLPINGFINTAVTVLAYEIVHEVGFQQCPNAGIHTFIYVVYFIISTTVPF